MAASIIITNFWDTRSCILDMVYFTSHDNSYPGQNGSNMGNGAHIFEHMWLVPVNVTIRHGYMINFACAFFTFKSWVSELIKKQKAIKWNSVHT
jgi:hypothetical protein